MATGQKKARPLSVDRCGGDRVWLLTRSAARVRFPTHADPLHPLKI